MHMQTYISIFDLHAVAEDQTFLFGFHLEFYICFTLFHKLFLSNKKDFFMFLRVGLQHQGEKQCLWFKLRNAAMAAGSYE